MPDTELPAPLLQAYAATQYGLQGLDWHLSIGQHQPALAAHFTRHAVQCATYLTACNPYSTPLTAAENAQRMNELRQALQKAGWSWLDGQGRDPSGQWPPEDSVLVWGMPDSTARAWGAQWQQNAVVFCGADCVPQLLLLQ